ncbi:hypothetical protein ACHAXN_011100 [Cyclotella atomus]
MDGVFSDAIITSSPLLVASKIDKMEPYPSTRRSNTPSSIKKQHVAEIVDSEGREDRLISTLQFVELSSSPPRPRKEIQTPPSSEEVTKTIVLSALHVENK